MAFPRPIDLQSWLRGQLNHLDIVQLFLLELNLLAKAELVDTLVAMIHKFYNNKWKTCVPVPMDLDVRCKATLLAATFLIVSNIAQKAIREPASVYLFSRRLSFNV
jgi:hypothetical protein